MYVCFRCELSQVHIASPTENIRLQIRHRKTNGHSAYLLLIMLIEQNTYTNSRGSIVGGVDT